MNSELIPFVDVKELLCEHGTMQVESVSVLRRCILAYRIVYVVRELFNVIAPVVWLAL